MGGGNNGWQILTNPVSAILPKKYSFFADPVHNFTAQGVENWYNVLTGQEKFGQHKDWLGAGADNPANEKIRRWTEGKNYKKWETWNQQQAAEYDRTYLAPQRERNPPSPSAGGGKYSAHKSNPKQNNSSPDGKPPAKKVAPQEPIRKTTPQGTLLLDDEIYPTTSYLR